MEDDWQEQNINNDLRLLQRMVTAIWNVLYEYAVWGLSNMLIVMLKSIKLHSDLQKREISLKQFSL